MGSVGGVGWCVGDADAREGLGIYIYKKSSDLWNEDEEAYRFEEVAVEFGSVEDFDVECNGMEGEGGDKVQEESPLTFVEIKP